MWHEFVQPNGVGDLQKGKRCVLVLVRTHWVSD
jgi:hypothetical protein